MIVAAFDFDGTITRRDSLFPFLQFVSGRRKFLAEFLRLTPVLAAYAVGRLGTQDAKEAVLRRYLRGQTRKDLQVWGHRFAREHIPAMTRPKALRRLEWHRNRKHKCFLISASLDIYLDPWASELKFDGLACSRLQFGADGRATGVLNGRNCRGEEKVRRLYGLVDKSAVSELYVYGDSAGDLEMLGIADHAYYREF